MLRILIVGAGAVGSVYGQALQRAGAEVTYLVKPKHVAERADGMMIYRHHLLNRAPESTRFQGYQLIDSIANLPLTKFDTVVITVPSHSLHSGDWLKTLAVHESTERSYWLCLSPGIQDGNLVLKTTGAEPARVAEGGIPILSYWAPLPGQDIETPGYAWWIPPGKAVQISPLHLHSCSRSALKSALSQDPFVAHWSSVAELLTRGGLPAKLHPKLQREITLANPLLRCLVAGLERSEWSLEKLLHGPNLSLVSESTKEAATIYASIIGEPDPMKSWTKRQAITPFALKLALRASSKLTPFDLEAFLQVHFTKVEEQMHRGIQELIQEGAARKLPTNHLRLLKH